MDETYRCNIRFTNKPQTERKQLKSIPERGNTFLGHKVKEVFWHSLKEASLLLEPINV